MRLFGYDIKIGESRSSNALTNPLDDRWYQPAVFSSKSGVKIDAETAMMYSAVYGCVKIISETIGSIPLICYKRTGDGKDRASNHAVYNLLKARPNHKSTALSFRETLTAHYLLRGNGYAEITHNYGGDPIALNILHPTRVEPLIDPDTDMPIYKVSVGGSRHRIIPFWEMFHLQGYTDSGIVGNSVISYMREAIGLGLAAEAFGSAFLANSATPSGFIKLGAEQSLSEKAKERLKTDWNRKYGGIENTGNVVVLDEGMEWKPMGIPAQDAQWLENRKFQITDIARFFRVPPHMLAELERSTNNNIEHQGIEFLIYTMLPHFVRWEQTISRDLFNASDKKDNKFSDKYFAEFLIAGLMRGDLATRNSAYSIGRQWGWLSVNDIREMENMNPIGPEGNVYLTPLNMIDSKRIDEVEVGAKKEKEAPKQLEAPKDTEETVPGEILLNALVRNLPAPQAETRQIDFNPSIEAFEELCGEAITKLMRREEKASLKLRNDEEVHVFRKESRELMEDVLTPFVKSFFHVARCAVISEGRDAVPLEDDMAVVNGALEYFSKDVYFERQDDWSRFIEVEAKNKTRALLKIIQNKVCTETPNE